MRARFTVPHSRESRSLSIFRRRGAPTSSSSLPFTATKRRRQSWFQKRSDAFREAMRPVGRARRRSGGERWGLFQDGADPERFLEVYVVPTWEEHLRQQRERVTKTDRLFEERALALAAESSEPRVEHLLWAYRD